MLLALDAGNTNVTIGLFEGRTLTSRWRLRTIREQTADEFGSAMRAKAPLDSYMAAPGEFPIEPNRRRSARRCCG